MKDEQSPIFQIILGFSLLGALAVSVLGTLVLLYELVELFSKNILQ